MALFRYHRGGLIESLATTIVITSRKELETQIALWYSDWIFKPFRLTMKIEPYPNAENCFDSRIGWYTHVVTVDIDNKDEFNVVGFLSEDL